MCLVGETSKCTDAILVYLLLQGTNNIKNVSVPRADCCNCNHYYCVLYASDIQARSMCIFPAMFLRVLVPFLAHLFAAIAETNPTCDSAYGSPHAPSCFRMLHEMDDPTKRFFGRPGIPRPRNVDATTWANRRQLPSVHYSGL